MGRESADLFNQNVPEPTGHESFETHDLQQAASLTPEPDPPETPDIQDVEEDLSSKSRKVVQIMLLYDDDTFVSYKPSE